jgi:hypothetical protein
MWHDFWAEVFNSDAEQRRKAWRSIGSGLFFLALCFFIHPALSFILLAIILAIVILMFIVKVLAVLFGGTYIKKNSRPIQSTTVSNAPKSRPVKKPVEAALSTKRHVIMVLFRTVLSMLSEIRR